LKLLYVLAVPDSLILLEGQPEFMRVNGIEYNVAASPGSLLQEYSEVHHTPIFPVEISRNITPLKDIVSIIKLICVMRKLKPEIVFSKMAKSGMIGTISSWLARVPIRIYNMSGYALHTEGKIVGILLRISEIVTCALANEVICISDSVMKKAIESRLCSPNKIKVLANGSTNGVDAQGRFNPVSLGKETREKIRNIYGIPPNAIVVGYTGRVVRKKGIVELIEAWRELRERYPNLQLLLVGKYESRDPLPANIMHIIDTDSRIHYTGFKFDVERYYAAMDIFCFPTYREGFGNVALEASAMELPVVATKVIGCVDSVLDGVTGKLVDPYNSTALVDAIVEYIENPKLRRFHGIAGRQRALRDFDPQVIHQALLDEYCYLAKKRLNRSLYLKHDYV